MLWPTVRKKCSSDREIFWNWRLKVGKVRTSMKSQIIEIPLKHQSWEKFYAFLDIIKWMQYKWLMTTSGNIKLCCICLCSCCFGLESSKSILTTQEILTEFHGDDFFWKKFQNGRLKKTEFFNSANFQYFFAKISVIGPWINWCKGH